MKWERKELLGEIYDKAVNGSEYMKQVEYGISKKLEGILSVYKEGLTEQEYMDLEEIVTGGVVVAEKEAFIAGLCYGMQLAREGYSIGSDEILKSVRGFWKGDSEAG